MKTNVRKSARSWSAPALRRFLNGDRLAQSGRGLPHSKTLSRRHDHFGQP